MESQLTAGSSRTPMWLNANKYGMSSLNGNSGYVRAIVEQQTAKDSSKVWGIGYGADVVAAYNNTSSFFIQQAYVEGRYKLGTLTIGQKQQPMELKNNELSSGSQTLGINSRPVPQVRIGLNDYWQVPFLRRWVGIKVHMAYGVMTDGSWQEDFADGTLNKYNKLVRYHEKAGYMRIGREDVFPLTLTLGLEMAAQFGGRVYNWIAENAEMAENRNPIILNSGLSSYLNAFLGFGHDKGESKFKNSEGNHLGSWVARLNWEGRDFSAGIYADHYFDDHSAMFMVDYDGYGSGAQWNERVKSRYFVYSLQDIMLGADMRLKRWPYINQFVVEYMNTRYQSGPVYHDHNQSSSVHISGRDDYYNHSILPGWQHWGQVVGNPLYLSPLYNDDGSIMVKCNRFKAWHFGIAGDPVKNLHYRVKFSWQYGLGTYNEPYLNPRENISTLLELSYAFPQCVVTAAYGADYGTLRGNNSGVQFTIRYKL